MLGDGHPVVLRLLPYRGRGAGKAAVSEGADGNTDSVGSQIGLPKHRRAAGRTKMVSDLSPFRGITHKCVVGSVGADMLFLEVGSDVEHRAGPPLTLQPARRRKNNTRFSSWSPSITRSPRVGGHECERDALAFGKSARSYREIPAGSPPQTLRIGAGYCATNGSAVSRVMPSTIDCAISMRSNGSLCIGGRPPSATACSLVIANSS